MLCGAALMCAASPGVPGMHALLGCWVLALARVDRAALGPPPHVQYYDLPSPSLRNALYPLMQANVAPFKVRPPRPMAA